VPPAQPPRHIYVHVPFCGRRCSYCDFSIAVRRVVPVGEFVSALDREMALRFPAAESWRADTLYFGGGTPSRLGGEGVARAIEIVRSRVELEPDAEVTIEANPEDISAESVRAWRDAGVNRISIGSQSFDDRILKWMHRTHDAEAIRRSVAVVSDGGIDNFSLDLIFALPAGMDRSWERDVAEALALGPSHLSLYGLTIESHTPLGRWHARGDVSESPDERYESEFLYAHDVLERAGLQHYEVSNFGRPGRRSRHNSSYWATVPYAGLGPSAHEFDGTRRRWNASAYAEWVTRLAQHRDPIEDQEILTEENRVAEAVYLGLRTTAGLTVSSDELQEVERWIEAGWARIEGTDRLVLTPLGWLRLDALAAALTHVRSRY
jgi:oxygen-independent coproporphyrinogen-3 oxidase